MIKKVKECYVDNICLYGLTHDIKKKIQEKYKSVFWIADDNDADIQPNKINLGNVPYCNKDLDHTLFDQFLSKNIGEFIKINSRNHFLFNKSYLYYEILLHRMCKYLWSIEKFKKIEFIVFGNLPHEGFDWVVLKYAEFKSIPYICLYQTLFPDKFIIWGTPLKGVENKIYDSQPETTINPFYMKKKKNVIIERIFKFLLQGNKVFKIIYAIKNISYLYGIKILTRNRTLFKIPNCKFIYFPLHLQPELTTSVFGDIYHNQILAVEELRRRISSDVILLIKENPHQRFRNRSISFYKELLGIKGVYFIDNQINSLQLIKKSVGVASICGTAGFEAICEGKPAIYFGDAWYKNFNGAFHITEISDLFQDKINPEKDIVNFINEALNGVVDPSYYEISNVKYNESICQTSDSIQMAIKEKIEINSAIR